MKILATVGKVGAKLALALNIISDRARLLGKYEWVF